MKKLFILAFATILSTNTYAIDLATNSLAYSLANTLYTTAMGVATSEATSIALSKNQKAEALRIQNEAQNYYQSGIASLYLNSKIQIAQELNSSLSEEESVDLLVEASQIILNQ